jgi:hypothetical protein
MMGSVDIVDYVKKRGRTVPEFLQDYNHIRAYWGAFGDNGNQTPVSKVKDIEKKLNKDNNRSYTLEKAFFAMKAVLDWFPWFHSETINFDKAVSRKMIFKYISADYKALRLHNLEHLLDSFPYHWSTQRAVHILCLMAQHHYRICRTELTSARRKRSDERTEKYIQTAKRFQTYANRGNRAALKLVQCFNGNTANEIPAARISPSNIIDLSIPTNSPNRNSKTKSKSRSPSSSGGGVGKKSSNLDAGSRSRSRSRKSGRKSASRGCKSASRGRKSASRGRKSATRGRKSASRGRKSATRGRKSASRGRKIATRGRGRK